MKTKAVSTLLEQMLITIKHSDFLDMLDKKTGVRAVEERTYGGPDESHLLV